MVLTGILMRKPSKEGGAGFCSFDFKMVKPVVVRDFKRWPDYIKSF